MTHRGYNIRKQWKKLLHNTTQVQFQRGQRIKFYIISLLLKTACIQYKTDLNYKEVDRGVTSTSRSFL